MDRMLPVCLAGRLGPTTTDPLLYSYRGRSLRDFFPALFSEVAAAPNNHDLSSESHSLGYGGLSRDLSQRVPLSGRG